MSDILKVLTRKNSLKKHCRELNLEELIKLQDNVMEFVVEREAEVAAVTEANQAKQDKIEQIRKSMEEAGIDIDDVLALTEVKIKKKAPVKYRLSDEEGVIHEWSGRGRTPKAFIDVNLEEYAV